MKDWTKKRAKLGSFFAPIENKMNFIFYLNQPL